MIERFTTNELTIKRWKRFKSVRRAYYSVWLTVAMIFFSATAEIWSNSKPLVMKFNEQIYFPVFKTYYPTEFGQEGFVTNYRAIPMEKGNWAVWPLVRWNPFESNEALSTYPAPPSRDNWFGTDDRGRDVGRG